MEWGWENESEQFIGPEMEGKPAGWEKLAGWWQVK